MLLKLILGSPSGTSRDGFGASFLNCEWAPNRTSQGIGCGFVIGPLYAAELSPARFRGMLSSLFEVKEYLPALYRVVALQVAIGMGILFGYAGAYVCKDLDNEWRWMIGLGSGQRSAACVELSGVLAPGPPLIIIACLVILPESPRFLWAQGVWDQLLHHMLAILLSQSHLDQASMKRQKQYFTK